MPERIFKYFTTNDLIQAVKDLGQTLAGDAGSVNQVRNSNTGFLTVTSGVKQEDIRKKFLMGRYEIYLRGKGVDGNDPEPNCAALEACNPLLERKMRVHTVYGWPLPYQVAPTVN
jgi:hypothetical protein